MGRNVLPCRLDTHVYTCKINLPTYIIINALSNSSIVIKVTNKLYCKICLTNYSEGKKQIRFNSKYN